MNLQNQGAEEVYKPPEVRSKGNPFNVEIVDQWEGETLGAKYHALDDKKGIFFVAIKRMVVNNFEKIGVFIGRLERYYT